jgi:transcriptional regulator with XRE-family HTH domain
MKIQALTPEPQILEELGRRLAQIRKQQRLSQTALAEEAGIGVATLRRIEAGKDSQMESWLKILRTLGLIGSINQLIPETFESPMAEVFQQGRRRRGGQSTGPAWGDEQS